jgi:DNA polymerase-3 subunit delta
MAPFQVIFVRNLRQLYTRGAKKDEFAALDRYFRSPNPQALLIFVADHIRIPSDPRRMEMDDKNRFERLRETLGDHCGMVELARVNEDRRHALARRHRQEQPPPAWSPTPPANSSTRSARHDAHRLRAGKAPALQLRAAAASRSAMSRPWCSAPSSARSTSSPTPSAPATARALALLHGLLNSSEAGEDAAIGHLYMLARTFRQMLVILEKNVRDSRAIWQALWQGFRMPPFAADDLIRQARRYKSRRDLTRALRLIARADLELRSSPPDKRLVLERLVYELASEPKPFAIALSCAFCLPLSVASEPLTVAAAEQSAARLASQQVLVRGHFWWGKEGSIIYDKGHRAIMIVEYSPAFNAKYPGLEIMHLARQGKFATVTGRLRIGSKRGVTLVADDISFSDK